MNLLYDLNLCETRLICVVSMYEGMIRTWWYFPEGVKLDCQRWRLRRNEQAVTHGVVRDSDVFREGP